MEGSSRINSIFDKVSKIENPSNCFDWESPKSWYKFDTKNIIHIGELQEVNPLTSAIYSTKYYAATRTELLCFSV